MARSPRVVDTKWGRIVVEGGATYKDAKLYPGGSREWDWNETGTRHVPGIQPADVAELLENGADIVVLSRGSLRRLKVEPETLHVLEEAGVEVHVLPTDEAVDRYNTLASEGHAVAALIHSTC